MSKRKKANKGGNPAPADPIPRSNKPEKYPLAGANESKSIRRISLFLFLVGFLLYVQTLNYDFTLDDQLLIYKNTLTTQGLTGIPDIFFTDYLSGSIVPNSPLYRPVSKALFAICWSISEANPMLYHLLNVLAFAITGVLLFHTLLRYLNANTGLSFLISLLFLTHPIHTEVVCNIKSLDEILSLIFLIASLYFLHDYIVRDNNRYLFFSALCFFTAFISKESAVTFLAIYPLAAYYAQAGKKHQFGIVGAMALTAGVVFGIRALVLQDSKGASPDELDNILSAAPDLITWQATAINLLGRYIGLLAYPHPLVCDYSTKQIELVQPQNIFFLLSLLLSLTALTFAFRRLKFRDWAAFGILYFFITISVTSNVFFLGGSHFAERFLYAPSLGFCILAGSFVDRYLGKTVATGNIKNYLLGNTPMAIGLASLITLYSAKIVMQNPVWRNNVTLFENGVRYSPNSYRTHMALAQDLSDEKYINTLPEEKKRETYARAINEAKTALRIVNKTDGYEILGTVFYTLNQFDSALVYYAEGLKIKPDHFALNFFMGKTLDKLKRFREAIPYLNVALSKEPENDGVLFNLALSYTNLNDLDKGLEYFSKIVQLKPGRADAYDYMGQIYRAKGDRANADLYFNKAREAEKNKTE